MAGEIIFFCCFAGRLSPNVRLLITNALFFKDAWTIPFEDIPERRKNQLNAFRLLDGEIERQDGLMMMRTSREFGYKEIQIGGILRATKFTVVTIPYKVSASNKIEASCN